MFCPVNCSNVPAVVDTNADISGVGVIVNFVATAGLSVVISLIYYVFAHDPNNDPFTNRDDCNAERAVPFRPNTLDKIMLAFFHWFVPKRIRRSDAVVRKRPIVARTLLKVVVTMSDIQLVTGYAILIAGYSQLCNGISSYNWQILTFLAWFSSLTHLCFLGLMRDYLYRRPWERLWRTIAMLILVFMLLAAIYPTGNFSWDTLHVTDWGKPHNVSSLPAVAHPEYLWVRYTILPTSHAVCAFKTRPPTFSTTFGAMVVSMCLIAFSFVSRVVKMHRFLDVNMLGRARKWTRDRVIRVLKWLHVRATKEGSTHFVRECFRELVYWPVLASFLCNEVLNELFSSMFLEVSLRMMSCFALQITYCIKRCLGF